MEVSTTSSIQHSFVAIQAEIRTFVFSTEANTIEREEGFLLLSGVKVFEISK